MVGRGVKSEVGLVQVRVVKYVLAVWVQEVMAERIRAAAILEVFSCGM